MNIYSIPERQILIHNATLQDSVAYLGMILDRIREMIMDISDDIERLRNEDENEDELIERELREKMKNLLIKMKDLEEKVKK